MCFDTSEIRDVVVLLQHSQGGGVQVVGESCTAHCWNGRVLATATEPTASLGAARVARIRGRRFPGQGGRLLNGSDKGWRQWGRSEVTGPTAGSTARVYIWA